MRPTLQHRVIAADPIGSANPRLVVAAVRAGAVGILDVPDPAAATALVRAVTDLVAGPLWVRASTGTVTAADLGGLDGAVEAVVVDGVPSDVSPGVAVVAQVRSADEARAAVEAGVAGLIAMGSEGGGRVGSTESSILLQQVADLGVPVWVRGGIGLHTAAAAVAGGAAGVVLDAQLALAKESRVGTAAKQAIGAMDGSETRVVGGHRIYTRPDLAAAALDDATPSAEVRRQLGPDLRTQLLPVGQDGAAAGDLARRFATVGGIVQAVRAAVDEHLDAARVQRSLAPGAGVAVAHGTRFPIAQGPMTRVSDRAEFAAAVADGGGLPFLALALLPGDEVRALLQETAGLLGDRPWGVGVLGFVPPEIRAEQLDVVHEVRPPMALIAGGRPSQAQPLEEAGISTYLHVPSPGLLDRFLKEGARKFVFEGRECGGHVGPRSSFALWDAQIERLAQLDDPSELQVLFAGGIHDARSAAMAAVAAATLAARGAQLGVLMGTAYLFTAECVAAGAIQPAFQEAALDCERTVLLETSPGHATRCVESDYVRAFVERKEELQAAGVDSKEQWAELETLNLGRLRIASKGIRRDADGLVSVDEAEQKRDGMYMIGDVATLRSGVTTIEALHAEVTEGAVSWLDQPARSGTVTVREPVHPDPLDIAIVGMDAFLPGATGADRFWAGIVAGRNAITEVPAERWDTSRYYDEDAFTKDAGRKTPSRWGGFLGQVGFDPLGYGIPPASLAAIEPVQLLSLEVASRALADAGYAERVFDRTRASVIFGAEAGNELAGAYGVRAFLPQLVGDLPPELEEHLPSLTEDSFPGVLTNVIAGRIANRLDLGGVNYTVDAACASSLAALDAACKELRHGISDLVVCGGADVHNGINDYLLFASVHALSPTGQCRTFGNQADGIALGEGIACLVLKRRVDAERDGDRIYAVIDAVAGSSDGRHLGLTAPRKEGQQRAVERAWTQAGVTGDQIGLVEAHGTGTLVGDRTELATLTELFAEAGAEPGSVVLGSVKSQIGHTKCTAGLAGLIKATKAVYHGVLPPTLNIDEPNAYYDAETSPFRFVDRSQPWPAATRRAAISAFGFGGTNFHTVISSAPGAPEPAQGLDEWPAELFAFRAASVADAQLNVAALLAIVDRIVATDADGQRHRLRDLACAVSSSGRGPVQVALVADDLAHLQAQLSTAAGAGDPRNGVFVAADDRGGERPTVGFLYPGQGSQRPGMLADLFVAFPWLADLLQTGSRWTGRLFPPSAFSAEERTAQQAAITATEVAQPTLGIAELAMTRVLRRLGVEPDAAAGHSYGELAALAAAGVLDDAALLDLSAARGGAILEAIEQSGGDPGSMAAVELPRAELEARLGDWPGLVVANHNGPKQAVISGPTDAVEAAVAAFTADGLRAKQLPVACAFHSPLVARAGDLLAAHLDGVELAPPSLPVWSNATADRYPDSGGTPVAGLLADQVASSVRFVEQVESMYDHGVRVFVEAGPGRVLTQQVGKILGDRPHAMVACDVSGEHGLRRLLLAIAELGTLGIDLDVTALFEERAVPVELRNLPAPRPGWLVDGAFVRLQDGTPVANSLLPADQLPTIGLGGAVGASAEVDGTVREYLQNVRQLVAAERDVMLQYLGGAVPATGRFDQLPAPGPIEATASVDTAAAAAGEPSGPRPTLTGDDLLAVVMGIVSDRTGYPVEMLDPDLDLEADLSIDSIKRIEIVGELAEKVGIPGMDESAIDEDLVEELAQLKTLRTMVAWLDELTAQSGGSDTAAPTVPDATPDPVAAEAAPELPASADRFEVVTSLLGPAVALGDLAGERAVVVGGADPLVHHLVGALQDRGASVEAVPAPEVGGNVLAATEAAVAGADVVVDLTTAGPASEADARDAFAVLAPAVLGKATRLLAVTDQSRAGGPTGVPGLARALARELPDKLIRSVEVDVDAAAEDPQPLAAALVDELLDADGGAALSWVGGQRAARTVEGPTGRRAADDLGLDRSSVVVLTGGARGITARAAVAIAQATSAHVVLVGRSPLPGEESPATATAPDAPAIRRVLLEAGELKTPAEIEAACTRLLADREIRATLAAIEAAGSRVEYHPCDVRTAAFADLLDDVRARLGRIDGFVHGAGVLDDRFVRDKTTDGFDRVYGTKVDGARTILAKRAADTRFVVLFGSVSGVFGNKGQCDYAAANDALDQLSLGAAPGGRVVSIDWGPWGGGGMVSPELEREYARRGVGLIDPDDGVAALLDEISRPEGPAQVVVLRGTVEAFTGGPTPHRTSSDADEVALSD